MGRWGEGALAVSAGVVALVLLASFARDGDWGFVGIVVGVNVVFYGAKALFRRSRYADPDHPVWPSKDPADYQ